MLAYELPLLVILVPTIFCFIFLVALDFFFFNFTFKCHKCPNYSSCKQVCFLFSMFFNNAMFVSVCEYLPSCF